MQAKTTPFSRHFWLVWGCWMLIVLGIHAITLMILPRIWQDEVQIIDWGRTAIDPGTDWSISWNVAEGKPVANPLYLGGVIQNVVFSLSGYNLAMPRLLSVVGGLAAATACLLLLLSFGHDRIRSAVLSSILLLDPVFFTGYRGNRVDCWAITAAFLSCLALQKTLARSESDIPLRGLLAVLSGAVAAIGLSIWFSFVLLIPLIAWQITAVASAGKPQRLLVNSTALIKLVLAWLAGFAACFALIQLPMLVGQPDAYQDLFRTTTRVVNLQSPQSPLSAFMIAFRNNPFLILLAGVSVVLRPRLDLVLFSAISLAGILKSNVYIHRAVYILPYCIVISSFALQTCFQNGPSVGAGLWIRRSLRPALWAGLALSIYMSLISRPLDVLASRAARQPSWLDQVAVEAIGQQSAKVLMEPWEFYVAGRKLGWKMFKPYFEDFNSDQLAKMDYIITAPSSKLRATLPADRFAQVGSTWLEPPIEGPAGWATRKSVYGPYLIYRNTQSEAAS
jgi:hypothetical protein